MLLTTFASVTDDTIHYNRLQWSINTPYLSHYIVMNKVNLDVDKCLNFLLYSMKLECFIIMSQISTT